MITTLTVNPALDLTLEVEGLLVEDVNRVKAFHEDTGGKGINVSEVLHELGLSQLVTLAVLGGRRAGRFKRIAKSRNLRIRSVEIRDETRINVTIYDRLSRKTTKLNQPGPVIAQAEIKKLLKACCDAAQKSTYFVMAGSLAPNLKPNWYGKLIRSIRREGLYPILDADGEALREALPSRPFLIKPNRYEAERVLGRKLAGERALRWGARRLRALGAHSVIISLGREGALFSGPEGDWRGHSIPVKTRSTIGAGDSLLAGFVYQLAKGKRPAEALRFGLACGTQTTMTGVTELCYKTEVMKLVSKMKIERIRP